MSIENDKFRLSQAEIIEKLKKDYKATEMLTVYFSDYNESEHSHAINCALIPIDQKDDALSNILWVLPYKAAIPVSYVYYENNEEIPKYSRFGDNNGIEPLVISRYFHNVKDEYHEISEEFRFFHNLYHDKKNDTYIKINNNGNEEVIITAKTDCIKIRTKEIRQFLAIKEMYLFIQFDYFERSKLSLDKLQLEEGCSDCKAKLANWSLCYGDSGDCISEYRAFSILSWRRLISPFPKSKSGLYGFTKEDKKYVDFIIDIDEVGNEVIHSSNPCFLANNFGANPNSPHYLTPVDFKKEVLDKYYKQPSKYSVRDSLLSCASLWSLQIDNHHDEKICVWLGDLGVGLSYEEQLHWRSHNIPQKGGVSETYFRRQQMAQFARSDRPEHIFKTRYHVLQEECEEFLGWQLLLPLSDDDSHHFNCLRVPATNEQCDFDELVLGLTKIIIDSLNEEGLKKFINPSKQGQTTGGISQLEIVLNEHGDGKHQDHIKFLRKLQKLRSSSVAHRKGKNYLKIANDFGINNKDLKVVFKEILNMSIKLIDYFCCIARFKSLSKKLTKNPVGG